MPGELTAKGKVVGVKQTRRALVQGAAAHVYLACDADPRLTDPLSALCAETRQDSLLFAGETNLLSHEELGNEVYKLLTFLTNRPRF